MNSKWIVVIIVVALVAAAGIFAVLALQGNVPNCTSSWACAAGYPIQVAGIAGVAGNQCAAASTYIYCVGGIDSNGQPYSDVYSGSADSNGNITAWTAGTNSYPLQISGESCVVSAGYLFCTGGFRDAGSDDTSSSYYAQIVNGEVGTWFYTTPYPVPVDSVSCVASSSLIYCIGGNNETDGTNGTVQPSDTSFYAALSETGIGPWNLTTSYPEGTYLPSCAASGNRVYCIGGVDSNSNPLDNAYYASLTPTGIGQWIPTQNYPLPSTGASCGIAGAYMYCVGGATTGGQTVSYTDATYSAPISSSGIGTWKGGPDFPEPLQTSCVIIGSGIYCVGGFDESTAGVTNLVRYASLSSFGT